MYRQRVHTEVDRIAPDPSSQVPLAQEVLLQFHAGGAPPQEQEVWVSVGGERVPAQVSWWAEPWQYRQVNALVEPQLDEEFVLFVVHWGEQELGPFEWSPETIVPGDLKRGRAQYRPSAHGCPGGDEVSERILNVRLRAVSALWGARALAAHRTPGFGADSANPPPRWTRPLLWRDVADHPAAGL